VRSFEVDDAEMTSIRISSLLPQQVYVIAVAAKIRVGVGISTNITAITAPFNTRRSYIFNIFSH